MAGCESGESAERAGDERTEWDSLGDDNTATEVLSPERGGIGASGGSISPHDDRAMSVLRSMLEGMPMLATAAETTPKCVECVRLKAESTAAAKELLACRHTYCQLQEWATERLQRYAAAQARLEEDVERLQEEARGTTTEGEMREVLAGCRIMLEEVNEARRRLREEEAHVAQLKAKTQRLETVVQEQATALVAVRGKQVGAPPPVRVEATEATLPQIGDEQFTSVERVRALLGYTSDRTPPSAPTPPPTAGGQRAQAAVALQRASAVADELGPRLRGPMEAGAEATARAIEGDEHLTRGRGGRRSGSVSAAGCGV